MNTIKTLKLIAFLSLTILFSCFGEEDKIDIYKQNSIGQQGEVQVVLHKQLWESKMGEIIQNNLAPMIDYFLREEYLFDLIHSSKSAFDASSKNYKNIIIFEVAKHPSIEPGVEYSTNVWAKDQVVIRVTGKSQQNLVNVFMKHVAEIKDYLTDVEYKRINTKISQNKNHLASNKLEKLHHLSITVPEEMKVVINNPSFAALESKKMSRKGGGSPGDVQQYILIYEYPYTSDSTFTKKYQIHKRDSIVKKYLKGSKKDSYMKTTPDSLAPIITREKLMKGNYAFETRGRYRMVNDTRGGPFIMLSLVDERRNRIITIEGNVFAPKFKKREFMMELEAMINSLAIL